MVLKRGNPGCPCCDDVCKIDRLTAETEVTQDAIRDAEHPQAPYPSWLQAEVRVGAGAKAVLFLAWDDATPGDGLYLEFTPESAPDLATLKIFRKGGAQIGDTLRVGCGELDTWHRITACYDPEAERITACVDVGEIGANVYHRQCVYADLPDDFAAGRQAGYGRAGSGDVAIRNYRFDRLWYYGTTGMETLCCKPSIATTQTGRYPGSGPVACFDLSAITSPLQVWDLAVMLPDSSYRIVTFHGPQSAAEVCSVLYSVVANEGYPGASYACNFAGDILCVEVGGDFAGEAIPTLEYPNAAVAVYDGDITSVSYTPGTENGVNARQTITLGRQRPCPFFLAFEDEQTAELSEESSAAAIQTALESLTPIGAGNVTVAGDVGGPFTVEFVGTLAAQPIGQLVAISAVDDCLDCGPYYGDYGDYGSCPQTTCHHCGPGCLLDASNFDGQGACLSRDLAEQFEVPASGVSHDTANGLVTVTESSKTVLCLAEHPAWPYSGRLRIAVRIAAGSAARLFVAAADVDNCLIVELEPDTSPPASSQGSFGWVRFYRRSGGIETPVGHQYLRLDLVADEWLRVSVWWDAERQRVSVQAESDAAQIAMVSEWFPKWITEGTRCGFGTAAASGSDPVDFDDYLFSALGSIDDTNLNCGEAPHSCVIVSHDEMLFGSLTMPASWNGSGGANWRESGGTHRTVLADGNVKVRAVFGLGLLDGVGDSTTVGVTGGTNSVTATLTETPADGWGNRQFEIVWRVNGTIKRTTSDLGEWVNGGGVAILACPTIVIPNGADDSPYFGSDIPGAVPDNPVGVTISQPVNGGTQLSSFEVRHHPAGLPTNAECPGCGTCRDLCDPPFDSEFVSVDLGPQFLEEQDVFLPWWDPSYALCHETQGVLELEADPTDTCFFEFSDGPPGGFEIGSLIVTARHGLLNDLHYWEVVVTLRSNAKRSSLYENTIATYRSAYQADCSVPDEGFWELSLTSLLWGDPSNPAYVLRCAGEWPETIKLSFDAAVL